MNLLLEIGAEEIPDWMLKGALEYLDAATAALLKDNQLGTPKIRTDATPRRLVVRAEDQWTGAEPLHGVDLRCSLDGRAHRHHEPTHVLGADQLRHTPPRRCGIGSVIP